MIKKIKQTIHNIDPYDFSLILVIFFIITHFQFSKISERFIHIHLIDRNTFQCVKAHSDVAVKLDKISSYPNYLALENLAKLLTRKTWIEHNSINIGNTDKTIIMIGKNERLRQNDKPAKFQSLEVQIFDIKFDKRNFSIEPKLIRKMSFLR